MEHKGKSSFADEDGVKATSTIVLIENINTVLCSPTVDRGSKQTSQNATSLLYDGKEFSISLPARGWITLPFGLSLVFSDSSGVFNKQRSREKEACSMQPRVPPKVRIKLPLSEDDASKLEALDADCSYKITSKSGKPPGRWIPSVKTDRGDGKYINCKMILEETTYEQQLTLFKIYKKDDEESTSNRISKGSGRKFFDEHIARHSLSQVCVKAVIQPKVFIMNDGQVGLYYILTHAGLSVDTSKTIGKVQGIDEVFPDEVFAHDTTE